MLAALRNTRRVNLGETRISEQGTFLVRPPCGRDVATLGVRRQEEHVSVAARPEHHGVRHVRFHRPGHQVAGDDAARLAVHDHDVEHLVPTVHLHAAAGDLLLQRLVCAEEQLLPRLAARVKSARYLRATERTVRQ